MRRNNLIKRSWKRKRRTLGMETLEDRQLLTATFLDYASERVILEPNNHYRDPFEWDKSGITLVTAESDFHSYQVHSVVASSPAEEAGVCRGDFLVEVDDRQADQWSLEALKKLFEQDRPVSIVLRRDGELIRTELNLRPLI